MNNATVAVLGLALFFLVYALLTTGRKHRGCTRCLDDEDAPRCGSCPLSRLEALETRRHAADDSGADIDAEGDRPLMAPFGRTRTSRSEIL